MLLYPPPPHDLLSQQQGYISSFLWVSLWITFHLMRDDCCDVCLVVYAGAPVFTQFDHSDQLRVHGWPNVISSRCYTTALTVSIFYCVCNFGMHESGFRPPLCRYRLNWTRRTSWGWWDDWDDTALQIQDSKFEPWRSETDHAPLLLKSGSSPRSPIFEASSFNK